jgi:hypothetical protein
MATAAGASSFAPPKEKRKAAPRKATEIYKLSSANASPGKAEVRAPACKTRSRSSTRR